MAAPKPTLLTEKRSTKTVDFKIPLPQDWHEELVKVEAYLKANQLEFDLTALLQKDFKKYLDKVKREIKDRESAHTESPLGG